MKKILSLVFCMGILMVLASCKGKSDTAKDDANTAATGDEISQQVSQAICKKVVECSQGQNLDQQKCVSETQSSISELLVQKIITLTKGELSNCITTINTGKCEEVLNSQGPPKGCEKLQ